MGDLLHGRTCEVVIGPPGQEGISIRDLRIRFDIEKKVGKEANTARVTITNLSESSRRAIREEGDVLYLTAGYEGSAKLLYSGDVAGVEHSYERPDWNTVITCDDSSKVLASPFTKSYAEGTPLSSVVADVASAFTGWAGKARGVIKTITGTLSRGGSFAGAIRDVLDDLERTMNRRFRFTVNDGIINVVEDGDSIYPDAVLLSAETGMIGSPRRIERDDKGGKRFYGAEATSLLNGDLQPGRAMEIESKAIKGSFVITRVMHRGDTHGQEWNSTAEGW